MRHPWQLMLILALLTSCVHKPLCLLHDHTQRVRVVFDWSDAPEANPAGMALYFYDMTGENSVQRFNLRGKDGGEIDVTDGDFTVICYNNDTEYTLFRSVNDLENHNAYTTSGDIDRLFRGVNDYPRAEGTEDETIVSCPDALWGCTKEDVHIEISDKEVVITLSPHELLATYTYEVRNVKNIVYLSSYIGILSGMSHCMNIAAETPNEDIISIPFEGETIGENSLSGSFFTFGVPVDDEGIHYLTFYMRLRDGTQWSYNYRVEDQIANAADKKHVHLVVENLELPTMINGDNGYDANVDDWQNEEYDVEM